jgi:hypothetical protein
LIQAGWRINRSVEQHQPDWNSPADKVARENNGLGSRWQAASVTNDNRPANDSGALVSPSIPAPLYLPAFYADVAAHHPDAAVLSGKQTNQEV